jgi:hypothetical protein
MIWALLRGRRPSSTAPDVSADNDVRRKAVARKQEFEIRLRAIEASVDNAQRLRALRLQAEALRRETP